ncbi:RHS repeat-associated core domain-containing protein [Marivirga sp.]|uniref:RHS repeat-associated core domain-containing protein n=1 Tax=Marivirga sp. TaxID=2018662 RepID=UPI0025FAAC27|nr:RHS repeat-associated core domain-containing protein [Marivirga sp.]
MGCLKLYDQEAREGIGQTAFFSGGSLEKKGVALKNRIDYYPFGLTFNSYQRSYSKANNYKYNGKEEQEETGWYDYGARNYDAALGRFFNQDRFSEKYLDFSPYQYAANNPILYIDVNGDSINVAEQYRGQFADVLGSVFGFKSTDFSYSEAGNVVFNGNVDDFNDVEKDVFNTLNIALSEETVTNIIFEDSYSITDNDGTPIEINTAEYGGEATATTADLNISQNYVIVNTAQEFSGKVNLLNPKYDPSKPMSSQNAPYLGFTPITTSKQNRTLHGIGHAIYRGNTQDKVLDFDNKTRRANKLVNSLGYFMNPLPLRKYDETHNESYQ